MAAPTGTKDVLYIDVDDEITAIIEKVQQSQAKIVALVLPKRATAFQSTVNMKILKRSAGSAKKSLVLITSESSLLPLAGAVGLHVASTLQSKPAIPAAPLQSSAPVSVDEIDIEEADDAVIDTSAAIGDLARRSQIEDDTPIEIDNDTPVSAAAATKKAKKPKKDSKLKVPNFDSFRKRLLLAGGLLALLIVGFVFASIILPKATIAIKTNTTEVAAKVSIIASPAFTEFNEQKGTVPGLLKEYKKTEVQKVPATGQKDMGTKASGSVTLSLTDCTKEQVTVPAGTTVTSGSLNFVTQVDVSMQSVKIGPNCRNSDFKNITTTKVNVVAQNAGDSYNLSARNYTVNGFTNVSGAGDAMSGGTSKVIKVVSQQDVDTAKQKAVETTNAIANAEIVKLLKDEGYFPLTDTFVTKEPVVTTNPGVDAESEEVTVSVTLAYTMVGAKRQDIDTLAAKSISSQIDSSQQKILNNGVDTASVLILGKKASGETSFELQLRATAGVEQNIDQIRQAVAGKKKNEAESVVRSRPGIEEVTVQYSPFWVSKIPNKLEKIQVTFEQPPSDNE